MKKILLTLLAALGMVLSTAALHANAASVSFGSCANGSEYASVVFNKSGDVVLSCEGITPPAPTPTPATPPAPANTTVVDVTWPSTSNVTQSPLQSVGASQIYSFRAPLSALRSGANQVGRLVLYEAVDTALSISATPGEFYTVNDPQRPDNFCQISGSGNQTLYYMPRNYGTQTSIDAIYKQYRGVYCELPALPAGQEVVYFNVRSADGLPHLFKLLYY